MNEHVGANQAPQTAHGSLPITFCCVLRCAALRRKLVDATVVVRAAVHSGAVEISESRRTVKIAGAVANKIADRTVAVASGLEAVNYSAVPFPNGPGRQFVDRADTVFS